MNIHFAVPDDIVRQLGEHWDDLSGRALEALVAEGYRSGLLRSAQVQRLLNHQSRWETDAFLKVHNCYLEYTEQDLERDISAIRGITGK